MRIEVDYNDISKVATTLRAVHGGTRANVSLNIHSRLLRSNIFTRTFSQGTVSASIGGGPVLVVNADGTVEFPVDLIIQASYPA